jgi:hypothetical protein
MRRSSTSVAWTSSWLASCVSMLLVLCSGLLSSTAAAQLLARVGRFVDVIEATDRGDQADIVVAFNCSLRYQTHLPQSEGSELRIQLMPQADCGVAPGTQIATELPPLSGGESIIKSVRVESDVPGQVTLVFDWNKSERFVLVQGVDPRSLRLRLVDRARGRVMVNEPLDVEKRYALNLDSEPKPFDEAAIQRAQQLLNTPAYVAEAKVDGETWYRLRVGPIAKRTDAEQLLKVAVADYPRVWIAIEDDAMGTATDNEETLPSVQRMGSDAPLAYAERTSLLDGARKAMSKRDYASAIILLTRLQRQPEYPDRAQVQELLGLAREKVGQLAHAKAEYEEYLRRYPQGEAAERVRLRLRTLREASLKERTGWGGTSAQEGWKFSGGFGQTYRYDGSKTDNTSSIDAASQGTGTGAGTSTATSSQNGLMTDMDFLARRRGDRMDITARVSAGYTKNFSSASFGANSSNTRLSIASVELTDRNLGLLARVGRQALNSGGVLGSFDGAYVSWNWVPSWGVQVSAGYPVELTSASVQTRRNFSSFALAFTPPGAHWDARTYFARQQFDGELDRQAVGGELRYLGSSASLVALADYDTYFKSLNTVALLGTWQLPARWNLSFDAERRNSPVLTTGNALIGENASSLAELEQRLFPDEIHQLAIDRTPVTSQYSVTLTRPLAQRFQFSATVSATATGATLASDGIAAQPATGTNLAYQAQLYGSNIFVTGDFNVLSFNYSNTEVGQLSSIGMLMRFPLTGSWRVGPRLSLEHRKLSSDQSSENNAVPALLLDYVKGRGQFQFETGGQIGKRSGVDQQQKSTRYYVSLTYRLGF